MIWLKKESYKSISKNSKTEVEIRRENFIKKNSNYENEETTENKLPKWLISLGVYLSREGPKLTGLKGGIESLRNQQIENHYLSKFIIHYDIKAIEFERNILETAKREVEGSNINDITNNLGENMLDNNSKENIKRVESDQTYKDLGKYKINVSNAENSTMGPRKQEIYFSEYKPVINIVDNNKDENTDFDNWFKKQTDSNEVFYDAQNASIVDSLSMKSSKKPQIELPKDPFPQNLSSYAEKKGGGNDSLQITKTIESHSSISSKKQKVNSRTQNRNRIFLNRLKESSDKNPNEETSIIQAYTDSEKFDNSRSFMNKPTLVKEYITPSLNTSNVVYGNGKKIKIINYDKNRFPSLEGNNKHFLNDSSNSNQNIEDVTTDDKKGPEEIFYKDNDIDKQNENDNVMFFNLEKSKKTIRRGSNLFHNKANSLSNSLKVLREGDNKTKPS